MCGVFGVRSVERDVARLTYFGLFALQHRGQESAGIAVSEGGRVTALREMGLVPQVFDEEKLAGAPGRGRDRPHALLDHGWRALVERAAARPPRRRRGPSRSAHNGNLVDPAPLRDELIAAGVRLASTSDTEVIAALLAARPGAAARGRRGDDAPARGRVLGRRDRGRRARRVPRPARDPAAHARPDRRRLGRRVGDVCARPRRRRRRARRAPRRGRLGRRRRAATRRRRCREGRGAACIFEHVYFARPDSLLGGTGSTRRACAWASGSRRRRRSAPTS